MPQCNQFVQNAWKKDLCSNCFKSKEEHKAGDGRSRYLATMIPVPNAATQAAKGILRDVLKPSRHPKGTRVIFPAEESQVIGYGGEECILSDDEDDVDASSDDCSPVTEESPSDCEHEREMQKLTRSNTDFNTVAANLLGTSNGEPKRTFTQLMLGKPLTDADGRKKTLLVTVQPFGGPEPAEITTPIASNRKTNVTRVLNEVVEKTTPIKKAGEDVGDIVLKPVQVRNGLDKLGERRDVIKLDVKTSETVERTNEITRSIVEKQSKDEKNLANAKDNKGCLNDDVIITSMLREVDNTMKGKEVLSMTLTENKINEEIKLTTLKDHDGSVEEKSSKIPLIKSRVTTEKAKAVIRTAAFNGRADLGTKIEDAVPKPAVRKTYEVNNRNTEYIIQKEKSSVLLNLLIDDKNSANNKECSDIVTKPEEKNKLNESINGDTSKEEIQMKISEATVKLTNGVRFELDLKPSQVDGKTVNQKDESNVEQINAVIIADVEIQSDVKTSPIVESKNSMNFSAMNGSQTKPEKPDVEEQAPAKIEDPAKKQLPANIYKKLPVLGEPIILKEITKGLSSTPVRQVTVVEEVKSDLFTARKVEGESAAVPAQESVNEEVYKATKVHVEGPASLEKEDDSIFRVEESRELAGEPDGRADSDELSEPPALPSSPPPLLDPRPSFLHGLIKRPLGDKPKIPMKSSKVFQATRKALLHLTPSSEKTVVIEQQPIQDNSVDPLRTPQKRRAPKPPPTPVEETSSSIFARNPLANSKSFSPITREKERRERASSCSPKSRELRDNVDTSEVVNTIPCPEPAPRRNLSMSVESLSTGSPPSDGEKDGKKKSHRSKFSIRKFLRLGSKDQEDKSGVARMEEYGQIPLDLSPKPRPEIIHPLELNGAEVEVLRSDGTYVRRNLEDSSSTSSFGSEHRDNAEASSDSFSSHPSPNGSSGRPIKPPPPPRNQSLDAWGRSIDKPVRPPPPKSAELLRKQKQPGQTTQNALPGHNVYANLDLVLGEVRSSLAPNKPQRSASIRETASDTPQRKLSAAIQAVDDGAYEVVEIRHLHDKKISSFLPNPSEGVYECVRNGSPECVDAKPNRYATPHRRSEGSVETAPDFSKFRGGFPRSASLPYCSSEVESEIYSPYSFYGSEDGCEDESDYASTNGHTWRTNKLRLRKGRSVVHKNLEDNYGAVITANHEALSQVLEQVNQVPVVPLALRSLKSMTNLRWSDFLVAPDVPGVQCGRRIFHSAQWSGNSVTLCIASDQSRLPNRTGTFSLTPLTEFSDLVPSNLLCGDPHGSVELIQASVAVLLPMQVDTIKSFGTSLREKPDGSKEASFVLLQLVNGLKNLQAQGIEESPLNLSSFVLCREEKDMHSRLYILQSLGLRGNEDAAKGSLCQCALVALTELMREGTPITTLAKETLSQERAVSLTQVKSLLEFYLWGPGDVALAEQEARAREQALQRWLDLERATVLHGLVRTRVELTSFEECHLLFLVRTSAKMMCEASFLLDSHRKQETCKA